MQFRALFIPMFKTRPSRLVALLMLGAALSLPATYPAPSFAQQTKGQKAAPANPANDAAKPDAVKPGAGDPPSGAAKEGAAAADDQTADDGLQDGERDAPGDAGAYLASRQAVLGNDYAAGVEWFGRALQADPDNPTLLEGSILSNIGVGDFTAAAQSAYRLGARGGQSQIGSIAIIVDRAARGEFDALLAQQKAGQKVGAVLDALVGAWSELGAGHMNDALAEFDALAKKDGLRPFALYHKALALAAAGDFEGAERIFSGEGGGAPLPLPGRGVMARIEVLSQLERSKDAQELMASAFGTDPDPMLDPLRARLAAGEALDFDVVRNATDGIAEVFLSLAGALNGEANAAYTLIYARAAAFLRPDLTDAVLLAGGLLNQQKQFDQAAALYASVPDTAPGYYIAEIGRAEATTSLGQSDAAIEILKALARKYPQNITVQVALGDGYKRAEKWSDALRAYDAALALPAPDETRMWPVYFSRGMSYERSGDFPKAEADMRKALELAPDQPQVLNYLGYSYVDRGEHLDEALDMIQRAVAARPDSGYIIDSLAWALYRLGRYGEAVGYMEKASLLEPVDPVVTDHLGDIYWAAGRQMEARFQWRRALSFSPEEKDATRIRRKLEVGLDAVLAEEGAKPLQAVKAAQSPADKPKSSDVD